MAVPRVSYQKAVLDNGVVVLTEKMPAMRSVSIGVCIQVRSRD